MNALLIKKIDGINRKRDENRRYDKEIKQKRLDDREEIMKKMDRMGKT